MSKAIALIITLLVGGILMIYSASRTLALLQMTLPSGQGDMAWLALAAFDGGLVAWTLTFMFGAEGGWQRGIAGLMIFVCMAGVIVGFGADSIIGASSGGIVDKSVVNSQFGLTVVLATVAIIALNIAAVVAFHVMSPANRRRMQEETFSDHIEEAAFKKSNEAIPALAASLAHELTKTRMARLHAKYQNLIVAEHAALPQAVQDVIDQPAASAKPTIGDKVKSMLAPKSKPAEISTLASEGDGVVRSVPEEAPAAAGSKRRKR